MIIIGVDYHPSFQQIAFVDSETNTFFANCSRLREPCLLPPWYLTFAAICLFQALRSSVDPRVLVR